MYGVTSVTVVLFVTLVSESHKSIRKAWLDFSTFFVFMDSFEISKSHIQKEGIEIQQSFFLLIFLRKPKLTVSNKSQSQAKRR